MKAIIRWSFGVWLRRIAGLLYKKKIRVIESKKGAVVDEGNAYIKPEPAAGNASWNKEAANLYDVRKTLF